MRASACVRSGVNWWFVLQVAYIAHNMQLNALLRAGRNDDSIVYIRPDVQRFKFLGASRGAARAIACPEFRFPDLETPDYGRLEELAAEGYTKTEAELVVSAGCAACVHVCVCVLCVCARCVYVRVRVCVCVRACVGLCSPVRACVTVSLDTLPGLGAPEAPAGGGALDGGGRFRARRRHAQSLRVGIDL